MSAIPFDTAELFPLLPEGLYSYQDAQEHSSRVDAFLGLRTLQVETEIQNKLNAAARPENTQYWVGLPVKSLLTPYTEIRSILASLEFSAGQKIIDLGAGYGRMAFVVGQHFPDSYFSGFEVVAERVIESCRVLNSLGYRRCEMFVQDLSAPSFRIPEAEIYFIYDFGTREAIAAALAQVQNIAAERNIKVVGRGRAVRDCIEREHPWLSQVKQPRHFKNFSIYSS